MPTVCALLQQSSYQLRPCTSKATQAAEKDLTVKLKVRLQYSLNKHLLILTNQNCDVPCQN